LREFIVQSFYCELAQILKILIIKFGTGTHCGQNEQQLCSYGGHNKKGEAARRSHLAIGIIICGTGTSFDFKKLTIVLKWREAAWRGHIHVFGTGTSFDFKK
jgi:hypothetical protein